MNEMKDKIREFIEATLIIGARRGAGVGVLNHDTAKELIAQDIDFVVDRVYEEFPYIDSTPRVAVVWFAERMEMKLKENDDKGGWDKCELQYLSSRLTKECNELFDAINKGDAEGIINECADVSNFSMMIADRFGENFGK